MGLAEGVDVEEGERLFGLDELEAGDLSWWLREGVSYMPE